MLKKNPRYCDQTVPGILTVGGFLDMLTEGKRAAKTSNSHSSAYMDTVEGELRSKSNALRSKYFFIHLLATFLSEKALGSM